MAKNPTPDWLRCPFCNSTHILANRDATSWCRRCGQTYPTPTPPEQPEENTS